MSGDWNKADEIFGEDWVDPRHLLLLKAIEAHPARELIGALQQETDEKGERRWSLCRHLDDDGWVEVWLRPWPLNRVERLAARRRSAAALRLDRATAWRSHRAVSRRTPARSGSAG